MTGSYLKNTLKKYGIKCAVSNHFEDIKRHPESMGSDDVRHGAFRKTTIGKNISYDEYLMPHCISVLKEHFPFETLYHPAFSCAVPV